MKHTPSHSVERGVAEVRRGYGVILSDRKTRVFSASAEQIDPKDIPANAELILTAKRAQYLLGDPKIKTSIAILLTKEAIRNLDTLIGADLSKPKAVWVKKQVRFRKATALEEASLTLMRIAELMPAAIISPYPKGDYLSVDAKMLAAYEEDTATHLVKVSEAPLTLKSAAKARIIAFRAPFTNKEHYAIIVGSPKLKSSPIVRIHSSCYTGDLLASLSCDCRDQLHTAIHFMADHGGGIVLYLMQEGRGIGLVNKLRAYGLKAKDMDTVEANEFLGFDDDERPFTAAAVMLKSLGVKSVRLLTNNPRKVDGLKNCGVKVTERVDHLMEHQEHNHDYLETKFSRLGHVKKK